jgi:molybdate transport system ATP-binding protein
MDEPLTSQDPARKAEILPYVERLRDNLSIPLIYVSHAVDEVARLADHLVILERGLALASGPATEMLARLDLPMARLDDGGVVIEARVAAFDPVDQLTRLDFGDASLWIGGAERPNGARVRVRVLARDVSVAREPPGPSSILNIFAARIVDLRDDGPDRVNIRMSVGSLGTPILARVTRRSRDALGLRPAIAVYALVKSVALVATKDV